MIVLFKAKLMCLLFYTAIAFAYVLNSIAEAVAITIAIVCWIHSGIPEDVLRQMKPVCLDTVHLRVLIDKKEMKFSAFLLFNNY